MVLPNFLVIGAQRAGTTFIHNLLSEHEGIFVPTRRKEIHYFDRYFERGAAWYERFFPDARTATRYAAIGEVTPDYLFEPAVPQRIAGLLPNCRLIISLRNPVERAYSGYKHHRRAFNEKRPLEELLEIDHDVVRRGFYAAQLERYAAIFPSSALLIIVFEEMVREPEATLTRIQAFLGLKEGWAREKLHDRRKINEAPAPRFQTAFYAARRFGRFLSRHDLDGPVELAKRLMVPKMFGAAATASHEMTADLRRRLQTTYEPDRRKLEDRFGLDLSSWGPS